MKPVIYLAGALILFATAFGLKDYFKAKKEGTLVNYNEPVKPDPVVQDPKKQEEDKELELSDIAKNKGKVIPLKPSPKLNSDSMAITKDSVAKPKRKHIKAAMFSRGRIDD
jgi:hypothetical protein